MDVDSNTDELMVDNNVPNLDKPKRERKKAQPKPKKERLGKIDVSKSIVDDLKLMNPDLYGDDEGGLNLMGADEMQDDPALKNFNM